MECVVTIEISLLRIGEKYSIHLSKSDHYLPSKVHLKKIEGNKQVSEEMQQQQQRVGSASSRPATQHQHNASVFGARRPTATTAEQQCVQHTQTIDTGQLMFFPPVSFLDGRVLNIVELRAPGTKFRLHTHTWRSAYILPGIYYHMCIRICDWNNPYPQMEVFNAYT